MIAVEDVRIKGPKIRCALYERTMTYQSGTHAGPWRSKCRTPRGGENGAWLYG